MDKLNISKQIQIMGVVNVTPDSFSDGGQFDTTEKAFQHAQQMIADGVDILDIGGESTRPGSQAVDEGEELARTIPLIRAIRDISDIPISIDTNKPLIMQQAVQAGAGIINSIDALRHDNALDMAAELNVPVCVMHMQGTPETMQKEPHYDDVVREVKDFLQQRIDAALAAGIARHHIIVDPGFGFGKNLQHNLQLLKALPELKSLGVSILVGLSRKRMIGTILDKPVDQRLYGSLSVAVISAMQGADIVRVHDVAETVDAIKMVRALNQVA
ncbi:MAG: dihydropteroate synthase [Gammaproteobacteria bacterium]|nr:dihydropteroate synthase [Gammaproteobacteria bacterium]